MRTIRLEAEARGNIVLFPDAAARVQRAAPALDEKRGTILLFTGVRYERMVVDEGPTPPVASNGSRRRR